MDITQEQRKGVIKMRGISNPIGAPNARYSPMGGSRKSKSAVGKSKLYVSPKQMARNLRRKLA